MSLSLTRDEMILVTKAVRGHIRYLENQLVVGTERKMDEKKENGLRDRIRWYKKIAVKMKECMKIHSKNLYHVLQDEFSV